MSKKMIYGVLLVVAGGLTYYYYSRKSSKSQPKMADGKDMMYSDGRESRARRRENRRVNRQSRRETMRAVEEVYRRGGFGF